MFNMKNRVVDRISSGLALIAGTRPVIPPPRCRS